MLVVHFDHVQSPAPLSLLLHFAAQYKFLVFIFIIYMMICVVSICLYNEIKLRGEMNDQWFYQCLTACVLSNVIN